MFKRQDLTFFRARLLHCAFGTLRVLGILCMLPVLRVSRVLPVLSSLHFPFFFSFVFLPLFFGEYIYMRAGSGSAKF